VSTLTNRIQSGKSSSTKGVALTARSRTRAVPCPQKASHHGRKPVRSPIVAVEIVKTADMRMA
jgi:hypothetical protein